jgi:hypothetical protein
MSTFLETLKERLLESQKRMQAAQAALQAAQVEHQNAAQEFIAWQNAVGSETRREQPSLPLPVNAAAPTLVIPAIARRVPPAAVGPVVHNAPTPSSAPPQVQPQMETPKINKSELVREALRHFPSGATPGQVWENVKDHVPRTYVYSVLKRMRDQKSACQRRGKYFFVETPKMDAEVEHNHQVTVQ